ncbi:MAG TPA: hypothetical protein VMM13_19140, partial [Euzebya sp.]|nr:hypothetical protein [Euzebya sp.]
MKSPAGDVHIRTAVHGSLPGMEDAARVHVETAAELADWFATNHASSSGVWVVVWRTATGRPAPSYDEAVCEALRFGWIDSVQRGLD